jgi:hypothetical protein
MALDVFAVGNRAGFHSVVIRISVASTASVE